MGGRPANIAKKLARTESDDDMNALPSSDSDAGDGGSSPVRRTPTPASRRRRIQSESGRSSDDEPTDNEETEQEEEHETPPQRPPKKKRRKAKPRKVRPVTQKSLNKMRWSRQVRRLQRAEMCCMSKAVFAR